MASAGANMNHLEHVSTQLPYVITVVRHLVRVLRAGRLRAATRWICLAVGAVLVIGALFVLRRTIGVDERKLAAESDA